MRRSFGPIGSGGGGGAMMRTVQRAVRTSYGGRGGSSHDPFSQLTTNYNNNNNNNNNSDIISLSSSHHPVNNLNNEYDDHVFANVPSRNEVHHALSFLQQVGDPSTSMLQRRDSVILQRLVSSVASDTSVWEAFRNSEAVRELRDSVNEGVYLQPTTALQGARDAEPSDSSILLSDILDWIYVNTKAQMMEVLEKTIAMVSNLFRSPRNDQNNGTGVGDEGAANEPGEGDENAANEPFENYLRSSFCLSVMVMVIVVLIRASGFRI